MSDPKPYNDPRQIAHATVDAMITEGLKKHQDESWRHEPVTMHLGKAARHAQTAILLLDHPEYTQDNETALEHAERALCRAAFVVAILRET